MSPPQRWRATTELISAIAVVLSLVFVGLEVRQNTAAVQTNTSQALYAQNSDVVATYLENTELADVLARAVMDIDGLTPRERLQLDGYLNLSLNVLEAAHTSAHRGTLDRDLADAWLVGLGRFKCRAGGERYWRRSRDAYAPLFRAAVDSAMAETTCSR